MRKELITLRKTKTVEDSSISFVVEKDYTQVYDCFSKMSAKINSVTSYKLLFWLLANKANTDGSIQVDAVVYQQFNGFLIQECGPECGVTRRTFDNSVAELKASGAITMLGRGHYKANAFGFWRGSTNDRKAHLLQEYGNSKHPFYNPDHDTKLLKS